MPFPTLTYEAEIGFARLYANRNPSLAAECARTALCAAHELDRDDLVAEATSILRALPGE